MSSHQGRHLPCYLGMRPRGVRPPRVPPGEYRGLLRAADAGPWPLAYAGDMSAIPDTFLRARVAGKIPAADLVVAAALTVLVWPVSFLAQSHQTLPAGARHLDAIAVVLMVAPRAVLGLRRLYAVPVLAAVFGLVLAYFSLAYPNRPVWLRLTVA